MESGSGRRADGDEEVGGGGGGKEGLLYLISRPVTHGVWTDRAHTNRTIHMHRLYYTSHFNLLVREVVLNPKANCSRVTVMSTFQTMWMSLSTSLFHTQHHNIFPADIPSASGH